MSSVSNSQDLVAKYETAVSLWDRMLVSESDEKSRIFEQRSVIQKELCKAEISFKLLKELSFNGEKGFLKIPELPMTLADKKLSDYYKMASDGSFMLSPDQLSSRIMRGYNPFLKVQFIALKGMVWEENHLYERVLYERVQILCTSRILKDSWVSNGRNEVVVFKDGGVLEQFMGISHDSFRDYFFFSELTSDEDRIPKALKIFADAPEIMKRAQLILSDNLPSGLPKIVIDYYNCEIPSKAIDASQLKALANFVISLFSKKK